MNTPITQHEGKKYLRTIHDAVDASKSIQVDIYSVLEAFAVVCPARGHALKKLLCCGSRGKGSEMDDLQGALAAINRAIDLEKWKSRSLADMGLSETEDWPSREYRTTLCVSCKTAEAVFWEGHVHRRSLLILAGKCEKCIDKRSSDGCCGANPHCYGDWKPSHGITYSNR